MKPLNPRTFINTKLGKMITLEKSDRNNNSEILLSAIENNPDWQEVFEPEKIPFMTTQDGVKIFDGEQKVFGLLPKSEWSVCEHYARKIFGWDGRYKTAWIYFSTEEARNEYIRMNKPRFSLKDIQKEFGDKLRKKYLHFPTDNREINEVIANIQQIITELK